MTVPPKWQKSAKTAPSVVDRGSRYVTTPPPAQCEIHGQDSEISTQSGAGVPSGVLLIVCTRNETTKTETGTNGLGSVASTRAVRCAHTLEYFKYAMPAHLLLRMSSAKPLVGLCSVVSPDSIQIQQGLKCPPGFTSSPHLRHTARAQSA